MRKHFGSLNIKTGVYVIGSDKQEVEAETGLPAYLLDQPSYERKDEFLPLFTDIVDLDAEPIPGKSKASSGQ